MATRDRHDLLTARCIPAIRRQSSPPAVVVIVNDGSRFSRDLRREIEALLSPLPAAILENTHASGAASAWNLGLAYLARRHGGFVATLDDDDDWDAGHLEINRAAALRHNADVVVAGLRRVVDGMEIPRPLVERLDARDFLVGNPGWQGSNTFVSMRRLTHVRGFRNGLASLNDRDLAVRVLRSPGVRTACTREWTSTWHVSSSRTTLSTGRSVAKISGLRWFWRIYGPEMSPDEASAFFQRADRCFGVLADEILHHGGDVPPHTNFHGDLHI